ncbi:Uncharacterised protein [Zhongshania aliphaticivorans]|uniref:Lipoprotein n=1 Tax=Zhongshania aliphaticivorans TaxID=1470434 RepID=A0A5S9NJP0_9GAMM|nr:hypothetical protein [Zhongshania aliphaticivorans]CAA0089099.1 Uncharacterised protein [Zhongshania aliphaticivorans]CAA0095738.1 Uncharacterised protein [Zhongshania aliphaticivorans]
MKYSCVIWVVILVLLQGCAGTRNSYKSLMENRDDVSAVYLKVGETKEVLAISHGFPGWWGVYPAIISLSPEIASVSCKQQRSLIPFRAPGLILGGRVCYVSANSVGNTWLKQGNEFTLSSDLANIQTDGIKLYVDEN